MEGVTMPNDGPPQYERAGVIKNPSLVVDDGKTILLEHPEREGEWWVCRPAEE
jgi:hypothetical protein